MFGRHKYGLVRYGADQVLVLDQFDASVLLKELGLTAQGSFDLELLKRDLMADAGSDMLLRGLVTQNILADVLLLLPQWAYNDLYLGRRDQDLEVKP